MRLSSQPRLCIGTGIALGCAVALCACTTEGDFKLPGVYRPDIQQGNVIDQEMIDKLKPGMDKNQVRFILGTPVLVDTFHADRWEYVFMYSEGGQRREQRHLSVYFKDEKLSHVEGDIVVAERRPADPLEPQQVPVDVPLSDQREGFFSRLFDALPFVGDDAPKPAKKGVDNTAAPAEGAAEPAAETGTHDAQAAALPQSEPAPPAETDPAQSPPEDTAPVATDVEPVPAPADPGAPQ